MLAPKTVSGLITCHACGLAEFLYVTAPHASVTCPSPSIIFQSPKEPSCVVSVTPPREKGTNIFSSSKFSVIGRVVSCGAFQVSLIPFSVCSARRFSGATACDISTLSIRSAILFSGISSIA